MVPGDNMRYSSLTPDTPLTDPDGFKITIAADTKKR
jgi:hypothetical protein